MTYVLMDNLLQIKTKKGFFQFWLLVIYSLWPIRNYDLIYLLIINVIYIIQSTKIFLVPKKCKIFFANAPFSRFAISISDFSLLVPFRYCSSNFAIIFLYWVCRLVHGFFSVLLHAKLLLFQILQQQLMSFFFNLKCDSGKEKKTYYYHL